MAKLTLKKVKEEIKAKGYVMPHGYEVRLAKRKKSTAKKSAPKKATAKKSTAKRKTTKATKVGFGYRFGSGK